MQRFKQEMNGVFYGVVKAASFKTPHRNSAKKCENLSPPKMVGMRSIRVPMFVFFLSREILIGKSRKYRKTRAIPALPFRPFRPFSPWFHSAPFVLI
jgi:hypothetical protein